MLAAASCFNVLFRNPVDIVEGKGFHRDLYNCEKFVSSLSIKKKPLSFKTGCGILVK